MSQFRVEVTILPRNGEPPHALEALVDTGAAYSMVPRSLIEFLGYRSVRTQRVILADGRLEEWPVSHVDVECQGRRTVTPVLMSAPGLLGATTLEELGLGVDPLNRRLVPVDLYLASA